MLGRARARRPYGAIVAWPLAVVGWPVWWVLLDQSMPYVWHLDRRAVATITPPGAPQAAWLRRPDAILTIAVPLGVAIGTWPATAWVALAVVAAFLTTCAGFRAARCVRCASER